MERALRASIPCDHYSSDCLDLKNERRLLGRLNAEQLLEASLVERKGIPQHKVYAVVRANSFILVFSPGLVDVLCIS